MAIWIPVLEAAVFGLSLVAGAVATKYYLDRDSPPASTVPSPTANQPPFTPNFEGGQCLGNASQGYFVAITRYFNPDLQEEFVNPNPVPFGIATQCPAGQAVDSITPFLDPPFSGITIGMSGGSLITVRPLPFGNSFCSQPITNISYQLYLYDYAQNIPIPDGCGNIPNPNPIVPINQDGGDIYFIGDEDEPEDGFDPSPILTAGAILAGLLAIANAIKGIGDALQGIQKIGEALEKIAELLQRNERDRSKGEKEKGDNRGFAFGDWYELPIDGGFGLKRITRNGKEYSPYQVQILFKKFPVTCSRRLGVNSVSFAHLEPIGWIFPRSVTRGFYEPMPVRYLNTIMLLPTDCDGFSFSFRENPSIDGKIRIIYSFPPEEEED